MLDNFNWQTDEETGWTDELEPTGGTAVLFNKHHWFRPLLVILSLLLLAGLVVFWQINRRAKAVTQAIKDDIIASYELLLTAADEKDDDLFRSLHGTDGRSIGWGRSLDTLLTNNNQLLNGRRPGLTLLDSKPQVEEIVLTSDLTGAELITSQTYAIHTAVHVTETITLRQVYNYELQEDNRWLMVAPDADFWGKWQTYESPHLRLSYPTRDEAISLRIATLLDKNLEQLCRWSADMPTLPPCPDELQFQVRWREQVGSLASFDQSQSERILGTPLENVIIFLPAPTLVGIPANEVDEQVLIDLYVQQTMAAMIRKLQDSEEYNWYRFSGFNTASLDWFLVKEGIAVWPPPAIPNGDSDLPPIPLPEEAIALTCLDETGKNATVVRLEPETGTWTTKLTGNGLVSAQILPGQRFFAQYFLGKVFSWAVIESDGMSFPIPETDEPGEFMSVDGRYIVAPAPPLRQYEPSSHDYVLDWEQCLQGDCQWHDIPGYPIWSPDGSQFLLQSWQDGEWASQILYGRSFGGPFELVAEGDSPIWLDEETISYRQVDSSDDYAATLIAATIKGKVETLLTPDDLEAYIPPKTEDTAYWFNLLDVASGPLLIYVNQYQTYSTSSEPPPSRNYLLLLDRHSREMTVVAEGEYLNGVFGGNGRYLITTQTDATGDIWSINRYDAASNQTESLFQYDIAAASPLSLSPAWGTMLDWSEDGQWLLVFRDGFLILLAPDYNYEQVIIPDTPGCFAAAWIKP